MIDLLVSVLILVGAGFALIGSIGLLRLPDFFTRLHGPTKATTLGLGAIGLGVMLAETVRTGRPELQELAITLFLFITAPVSASMLARAARARQGDAGAGGAGAADVGEDGA
jgi:multicomponent K+:H+ antiporter subunit G